jgi:hypothetical protein
MTNGRTKSRKKYSISNSSEIWSVILKRQVNVFITGDILYSGGLFLYIWHEYGEKLLGLSPRANYTDRATAACRRSWCQRLRIEGATWSVWRIPTAVRSRYFFFQVAPQLYSRGRADTVTDPLFLRKLVAPGIDPEPLDLWPGTLTTTPQRQQQQQQQRRQQQ